MNAMQHAFLAALLRWAARVQRAEPIALPVGRVDPGELRQVLIALVCAQPAKERRAA
jgi:hypothetical protein